MERQTYLYMEMTLAHTVFRQLYFEEYLEKTSEESRILYMEWYKFNMAIDRYWNTPPKERPMFLMDNVEVIL